MNFVIVHNFLKVFYNCNIWWWPCKAETCCILILSSSKFELWLMVPLFLFLYMSHSGMYMWKFPWRLHYRHTYLLSIIGKTASIHFYHCVPLGMFLFPLFTNSITFIVKSFPLTQIFSMSLCFCQFQTCASTPDTEIQSEQHDRPEDWNTILVIFYNQQLRYNPLSFIFVFMWICMNFFLFLINSNIPIFLMFLYGRSLKPDYNLNFLNPSGDRLWIYY